MRQGSRLNGQGNEEPYFIYERTKELSRQSISPSRGQSLNKVDFLLAPMDLDPPRGVIDFCVIWDNLFSWQTRFPPLLQEHIGLILTISPGKRPRACRHYESLKRAFRAEQSGRRATRKPFAPTLDSEYLLFDYLYYKKKQIGRRCRIWRLLKFKFLPTNEVIKPAKGERARRSQH